MRARGIHSAEIIVRVPFFDVDPMQIVWHGHYVKYLEQARCALLDSIGYGYAAMQASGYSFPVIDLQLRYMKSAVFDQSLRVRAELVEWANRLKINYLIRDADSGARLTRGSTVQVAIDLATGEMRMVSPAALCAAVAAIATPQAPA
jgi:acyl-CoA thioester hydrolase